jgi:hypothetical protein
MSNYKRFLRCILFGHKVEFLEYKENIQLTIQPKKEPLKCSRCGKVLNIGEIT